MLIRFDNAAGRGPSGQLWGGIADWPNNQIEFLNEAAARFEDFSPYLGDAVGIALSGDSGSAAAVQSDERFGCVNFTASQAADAVAGYNVNYNVDLDVTGFRQFCMEARVKVEDDNSTTQTFIGLTDEALDGFFGSDNTPDGSAIGVRWNSDETLDLVSIASDDTITVLSDAFATVERTVGFVKIGFSIELQDGTNYLVRATVTSGSGTSAQTIHTKANTATVPGAAGMKPAIIHTNDNQAAPSITVDWDAYYEKV